MASPQPAAAGAETGVDYAIAPAEATLPPPAKRHKQTWAQWCRSVQGTLSSRGVYIDGPEFHKGEADPWRPLFDAGYPGPAAVDHVTAAPAVNPRSVDCPTCPAKAGQACKRPSGHRVFGGESHADRVKLAAERAAQGPGEAEAQPQPDPATFVCGTCGELRRRTKGNPDGRTFEGAPVCRQCADNDREAALLDQAGELAPPHAEVDFWGNPIPSEDQDAAPDPAGEIIAALKDEAQRPRLTVRGLRGLGEVARLLLDPPLDYRNSPRGYIESRADLYHALVWIFRMERHTARLGRVSQPSSYVPPHKRTPQPSDQPAPAQEEPAP